MSRVPTRSRSTVPFADRDELRDDLWQLLGQVRKSGSAQVVVLAGPAGVGKSRLAQWLGERAEELGVGTLLSVFHRPNGAPGEALGRTFSLRLACSDLEPSKMTERTSAFLGQIGTADPYEARALAATIDRALHGDDEPVHTFNSPLERYALLGRILRRMGRIRPVVVWLDDINFDPDAVTFVRAFFRDAIARQSRVLFVLTERSDGGSTELAGDLSELLEQGVCRRFEVGPLPEGAHFDLVHDHLGIDETLARQLVAQTGGNPLFTIQLLDDWVQRGLLTVSNDGFALATGDGALDFPATMRAAWMRRLASTLTRQETVALELAATIGDRISPQEWAEVCRATAVRDSLLLLDRLIKVRLARTVRGGWAFVHRQLRESLLEHASDNDRAAHHHRAAAAIVTRLHPRTAHARLAHHLESAGEAAKARQARIDGARMAGREGDAGTVLRLLEAVDEPTADAWALMARAHRLMGQSERALDAARRGFHVSDTQHERACVLLERAQIRRGPMDTQVDPAGDLRDALAVFKRSDPRRAAECQLVLGEFHLAIGDYDAAYEQLHQALHGAQRLDDRPAIARAQVNLGDLALRSGDPARALELLTHAQPIVSDAGNRYEEARLHEIIGDAHRAGGNLAAAEQAYADAAREYRSVGSPAVASARVNLALVRVHTGRYRAARRELESVLPDVQQRGWERLLPTVHILLLPCAAAAGDWEATRVHADRAKALVRQARAFHLDFANAFVDAAERAEEAGQTELARDLYLGARQQWVRLGGKAEAHEMRAKADALG
jgi:eukaryotic-like serine/threonine-protein kinase